MTFHGERFGCRVSRREFLATAGAVASLASSSDVRLAAQPQELAAGIPIIDTHVHFFDGRRPQGVPYPGGGRRGGGAPAGAPPSATPPPPRVALPSQYRADLAPLGIKGVIQVEASPWVEDNLWSLETIDKEPIVVGTIGNLQPDKPEFREYLDRYRKNKLFLGIRYGNLWGYDLVTAVDKPEFIAGVKEFASTGLLFETANPRLDLIGAVVNLTDQVPDLRVCVNHLAQLDIPTDTAVRKAYIAHLEALRQRNVFVKVSGFGLQLNGQPNLDPASYKPMFDFIYDIFGEDRVLFTSWGWPGNVENVRNNMGIVIPYFAAKGRTVAEKFLWRNSVAAYKWIKRSPDQPQLA